MGRIDYLKAEHERILKLVQEKNNNIPSNLSYQEWLDFQNPEAEMLDSLSQEIRLIVEPVFEDLDPKSGDVMSLEDFVESVKNGDFIDYDGYGHYVRGDKESDVTIIPSDVIANKIRTDFDTIIWYNR